MKATPQIKAALLSQIYCVLIVATPKIRPRFGFFLNLIKATDIFLGGNAENRTNSTGHGDSDT